MDRGGAWQAMVQGAAKSWIQLNNELLGKTINEQSNTEYRGSSQGPLHHDAHPEDFPFAIMCM